MEGSSVGGLINPGWKWFAQPLVVPVRNTLEASSLP
jgi:hypothetical protein